MFEMYLMSQARLVSGPMLPSHHVPAIYQKNSLQHSNPNNPCQQNRFISKAACTLQDYGIYRDGVAPLTAPEKLDDTYG